MPGAIPGRANLIHCGTEGERRGDLVEEGRLRFHVPARHLGDAAVEIGLGELVHGLAQSRQPVLLMVHEEAAGQRHRVRQRHRVIPVKGLVRAVREDCGELQLEAEMVFGGRVVGRQIEAAPPVVGHRAVAGILHEDALLAREHRLVGRRQNAVVAAGAEDTRA